jgi:hypothetical protein
MENKENLIKTEVRTRIKRNKTTGKYAGTEKYKVVINPQDISIDEMPPPGFETNELTTTSLPKIQKRTKNEVGNYNADLTAPKD